MCAPPRPNKIWTPRLGGASLPGDTPRMSSPVSLGGVGTTIPVSEDGGSSWPLLHSAPGTSPQC